MIRTSSVHRRPRTPCVRDVASAKICKICGGHVGPGVRRRDSRVELSRHQGDRAALDRRFAQFAPPRTLDCAALLRSCVACRPQRGRTPVASRRVLPRRRGEGGRWAGAGDPLVSVADVARNTARKERSAPPVRTISTSRHSLAIARPPASPQTKRCRCGRARRPSLRPRTEERSALCPRARLPVRNCPRTTSPR